MISIDWNDSAVWAERNALSPEDDAAIMAWFGEVLGTQLCVRMFFLKESGCDRKGCEAGDHVVFDVCGDSIDKVEVVGPDSDGDNLIVTHQVVHHGSMPLPLIQLADGLASSADA